MKKCIGLVCMLGALLTTGGHVATAAPYPPYPPAAPTLTVDSSTPAPHGAVAATVSGCIPGEAVTFSLPGATATIACSAQATAKATLAVPGQAGAITLTAVLAQSATTLTAALVVGATTATIPATGSDTQRTTGVVALGFVAAGALAVGFTRRRQHARSA